MNLKHYDYSKSHDDFWKFNKVLLTVAFSKIRLNFFLDNKCFHRDGKDPGEFPK